VSPAFDGYPQSFISQLALINPVGAMLAAICFFSLRLAEPIAAGWAARASISAGGSWV
jgi:hypothetical protein